MLIVIRAEGGAVGGDHTVHDVRHDPPGHADRAKLSGPTVERTSIRTTERSATSRKDRGVPARPTWLPALSALPPVPSS